MPVQKGYMTVYETITQTIIDKLNAGVIPWKQSWRSGAPCNAVTARPYSGLNLWMTLGYANPQFLTFKQALAAKVQIKKGAKTIPIVFWKKHEKEDGDSYMSCQYYRVFNVDSIEDSPEKEKLLADFQSNREIKVLEKPQAIVDGFKDKPEIKISGDRAYYAPALDKVYMPHQKTFNTDEDYYSVLFHELAHSTGNAKRLKREGFDQIHRFGDANYSKEELVAEFTAAFLCGECGIDSTIEQSAAYIQGWVKKLKDHPKMLFEASSQATKAAKYIRGVE